MSPTPLVVLAIIGGAPAPSETSVVAVVDAGGRLTCSGTVVAPRVVLTAAHCLAIPPAEILVEDRRVAVRAAEAHPGYDAATFAHDVALLFVAEELPVAPEPLPATRDDGVAVGDALTFVGYGFTQAGAGGSYGERRARVAPVTTMSEGKFSYGEVTCYGDSGGPAFLDGSEGRVLVGVTSSGPSGCAFFGLSSRTVASLDWIRAGAGLPAVDDGGGCATGRGRGGAWAALALLALSRRRARGAGRASAAPTAG